MQVPQDTITDITIIGGGPTGLAAAYYGGHRGASVRIIDTLQQLGGQVRAAYPEKHIYDIAGYPKVLASDFCDRMQEQALQFNPEVMLECQVCQVEHFHQDDQSGDITQIAADEATNHPSEQILLRLTLSTGESVWTRTLIIAGGHGAFTPRKLTQTDGDAWQGKGLSYMVDSKDSYRNKHVVIIGGGDSAMDWATELATIAGHVTLVHRRDRFRAHEHTVERLHALVDQKKASIKTPHEVTGIAGNGHVQHVTLTHSETGVEEIIQCDALLPQLGFISKLGPIADWGLEMYSKKSITVNTKMQTNLANIYAAGDIAGYDGKLTLITIDMGEAAIAANMAITAFRPDARAQPAYSTE